MKQIALTLTLLIGIGFYANAQKVKYKDLYVLLRAKNYKDAAPFLTKFIAANPEHPNANYQMGLMLEFKLRELDILKQSEAIINRADSSILFFSKAYTLINEKDVKKHDDDYYENFKRRNLRTGKFEVILSDVQLDIENRKNELSSKKKGVNIISHAFNSSTSLYDSARLTYKSLKDTYVDSLSLSMGANDSIVSIINSLIINYDSSVYKFKRYKRLKNKFDPSSEETIINISRISGFDEKGFEKPDFYASKVEFINFSSWGNDQLGQIKKQRQFLKALIQFDSDLESLAQRIMEDSVDLSSEILEKITDHTLKTMKAIDPTSAVYGLLNYKIGMLNVNSALDTWYANYADTIDVGLQLIYATNLVNELKNIELLQASIGTTNGDQFWTRYHSFVNARYSSLDSINSFIEAQPSIINSKRETITQLMKLVSERDKWAYSTTDTIPLFISVDSLSVFKTFYVDSLENRVLKIAGLINIDDKGYFYFSTVPSSRQLDSLYLVECSLTIEDVGPESFILETAPALIGSEIILIGSSNKNTFRLIHFSEKAGIMWNETIELTDPSSPILSYSEGQILIKQSDALLKFQLEDGASIE